MLTFFLPELADGASESVGYLSEVVTWLWRDCGYSRCALLLTLCAGTTVWVFFLFRVSWVRTLCPVSGS